MHAIFEDMCAIEQVRIPQIVYLWLLRYAVDIFIFYILFGRQTFQLPFEECIFFNSYRRMQRTKAEQQLRVVPSHLGVNPQDEDEEEGKPGENKEGSKSEQARMKG